MKRENEIIPMERLRHKQSLKLDVSMGGLRFIVFHQDGIHAHNVLRYGGKWYSGWLSHSPWWLCKELGIHQPTLFPLIPFITLTRLTTLYPITLAAAYRGTSLSRKWDRCRTIENGLDRYTFLLLSTTLPLNCVASPYYIITISMFHLFIIV